MASTPTKTSQAPAGHGAQPDEILVRTDDESYRSILAVLYQPPGGEGLAQLMTVPKPWLS